MSTSFNEPDFTTALRNQFLDIAGVLLASHGADQVGITRRCSRSDEERGRFLIVLDEALSLGRLQQLVNFETLEFKLPEVQEDVFASLRKIVITVVITSLPLPGAEAGVGLDADGLRYAANITMDWLKGAERNEGAGNAIHKALKAWALRQLAPSLAWFRRAVTASPDDYGFQMYASPHQLKETVTYAKPFWWNE